MANRLRKLRKAKKLSQTALAKEFNDFMRKNQSLAVYSEQNKRKDISYGTVSNWERGIVHIPSIYIHPLSEFFGVTVAYFQGLTVSKDEFVEWINQSYVEGYLASTEKDIQLEWITYKPIAEKLTTYFELQHIEPPIKKFSGIELNTCSDDVKKYWLTNLSFFFADDVFIPISETVANDRRHGMSVFSAELSNKIDSLLKTPIRNKFDQIVDKSLSDFVKNKQEILGFHSKKQIRQQIKFIEGKFDLFLKQLDDLPDNKPLK